MFTLFGWGGQHAYNYLDARNSRDIEHQSHRKETGEAKPRESLTHKLAKSKWSPVSVLSDDEYENMIKEKLLKVEAEIAIIDERIEGYKQEAAQSKAQQNIIASQAHMPSQR